MSKIDERTIRMQYIGACALLGRVARHVKNEGERYCIRRALDTCATLVGMSVVECTGGELALEPAQAQREAQPPNVVKARFPIDDAGGAP